MGPAGTLIMLSIMTPLRKKPQIVEWSKNRVDLGVEVVVLLVQEITVGAMAMAASLKN